MVQVVILISGVMFAGVQSDGALSAPNAELLQIFKQFDVEFDVENAVPDPERPDAVYLTVSMDDRADEFVATISKIDGVLSAYLKPEAALP